MSTYRQELRAVAQNIADVAVGADDAELQRYADILSSLSTTVDQTNCTFTLNVMIAAYDSKKECIGPSRSLSSSCKAVVKGAVAKNTQLHLGKTQQVCCHRVRSTVTGIVPAEATGLARASLYVVGLATGKIKISFLDVEHVVGRVCSCTGTPTIKYSKDQSLNETISLIVSCNCSSGWIEFITCRICT